MPAIVTTAMRVHAANQFYAGFSDPTLDLYLFIGHTLSWNDDNSPPTPIDCEFDESSAYRDMLSLKKIQGNNVSLVMPRHNWQVGTIYTQYQNNIDLFDPNSNLPSFYVVTDALNVYKCLNNNGGAMSESQPTGTTTSVVTNADGYQWKYMFTVNSADVLNFVTTDWIPVKTLSTNDGSLQWQVQQEAIPGTIDRIDVLTTGTQYTQIPTVTITGDGVSATAVATITTGNVTAITVTNTGQGYTWANVDITNGGVAANGATVSAVISPFEGHGSDPITELGGFYVLLDTKLIGNENGLFTVTNDYRTIGILKNPLLNDGVTRALALAYSQTLRLTFSTVSGTTFDADEIVTGSISNATGVVLDWDSVNSVLRLVQVLGDFIPGETVVGENKSGVLQTFTATASSATSSTIVLPNTASATNDVYTGQTILISSGTGNGQTRKITAYVGISRTATIAPVWTVTPDGTSVFVIASIVHPDVQPFSGDILYMENRRPIARAIDQTENVKIVVEF